MPEDAHRQTPLLEVRDLHITFHGRRSSNHAVKGIDFSLDRGETLAIVGESGSGKSVTALALTRLLPPKPACEVSGQVNFDGQDLFQLPDRRLRQSIRGRRIAYIFQEPGSSLNPYHSIGDQIAETIRLHRPEVANVREEVVRALDMVGIRDAAKRIKDYPFQMSGGMQQRVMIAMGLACEAEILVADEPTTALDVTIQAQIMDLLRDIRDRLGTAIILITHNFGIVDGFANHLQVMFRGKIVESGVTEAILKAPQHAYTRALIDCIPKLGAREERLSTIDHAALS